MTVVRNFLDLDLKAIWGMDDGRTSQWLQKRSPEMHNEILEIILHDLASCTDKEDCILFTCIYARWMYCMMSNKEQFALCFQWVDDDTLCVLEV